MLYDYPAF